MGEITARRALWGPAIESGTGKRYEETQADPQPSSDDLVEATHKLALHLSNPDDRATAHRAAAEIERLRAMKAEIKDKLFDVTDGVRRRELFAIIAKYEGDGANA